MEKGFSELKRISATEWYLVRERYQSNSNLDGRRQPRNQQCCKHALNVARSEQLGPESDSKTSQGPLTSTKLLKEFKIISPDSE